MRRNSDRECKTDYALVAPDSLLDLGGIGGHTLACQPKGTLAFNGHREIPRGLLLYPKNLTATE